MQTIWTDQDNDENEHDDIEEVENLDNERCASHIPGTNIPALYSRTMKYLHLNHEVEHRDENEHSINNIENTSSGSNDETM